MRKRPILFFLLLLLNTICRAQSIEIKNIQRSLPLIHDSLRYVDALNRLAMLLYEKNIDSTFAYTKQAREIADRLQYAKGKADALNNLGVVYDIKGNLQLGLRYYNEAYTAYTALNDSANRVQTRMNIAEVYQELGKDKKAINNFKAATAMGNKLTRDSVMAFVIYNFLLEYPDAIPKDSLNHYVNKARNIAKRYHDNRISLALDQLEATNYIKQNQRDKGLALLKQTLDNAIKTRLYFFSLDVLINLGDQLAMADSAMAAGYYKQGLAISNQNGYLIYSQITTGKLKDFYQKHNDKSTELYYSRLLIELHDKQDQLNNASGIDYIDYAFKDQQLESVRIRSKYQSGFLVLTVVICLMAVILIIILWRNWKNTQKTARVLRLQFEQAEATTEALDIINKNYARLIKIVAHDLRNPIGAVSTISSMLARKDLGDDNNELVKMMQTSAGNSLNLIGELLKTDFDQQQSLDKEELDLKALLQQCVQLLSFRARDKNQQITLNTADEPIKIYIDKEKINRVINNLVTNAFKFSPDGAIISVAVAQVENTAVITVTDAGIGIPAVMQHKIFDPFTTARRKGTSGEQPFGLGLYISKQIVEAHHGKIGFKSAQGAGTEFFVELPLL
jgi:signal transduction histidine kinase